MGQTAQIALVVGAFLLIVACQSVRWFREHKTTRYTAKANRHASLRKMIFVLTWILALGTPLYGVLIAFLAVEKAVFVTWGWSLGFASWIVLFLTGFLMDAFQREPIPDETESADTDTSDSE